MINLYDSVRKINILV